MDRPKTEDEALRSSELCIRVFETVMSRVEEDQRFRQIYPELYGVYMDVLAEELAPLAFDLAYELFGKKREGP